MQLPDLGVKTFELFTALARQSNFGLKAILPAAMNEEPLLRAMAEMPLIEFAVHHQTDFFKEFAHQRRLAVRDRDIVRAPRISRNRVLAVTGIAARLLLHLEQHKVPIAALVQPPRSRKSRHSRADNHQWNFALFCCNRECAMVAELMPKRKGIHHIATGNGWLCLPAQLQKRSGDGISSSHRVQ